MAVILILTKKGDIIKTNVKENVSTVWEMLNGCFDPNIAYNQSVNRDYLLLTDENNVQLIINKRFVWKIEE